MRSIRSIVRRRIMPGPVRISGSFGRSGSLTASVKLPIIKRRSFRKKLY